jgi:hypothetical protein
LEKLGLQRNDLLLDRPRRQFLFPVQPLHVLLSTHPLLHLLLHLAHLNEQDLLLVVQVLLYLLHLLVLQDLLLVVLHNVLLHLLVVHPLMYLLFQHLAHHLNLLVHLNEQLLLQVHLQ